ncbi:MAG: ion channel [Desulfuromonadales bacterium]
MILTKISIVSIMLIVTTAIHACGMLLAMKFSRHRDETGKAYGVCKRILRLSFIVICMFIVSLIEVTAWAAAYLAVDAIEALEKAIYFSMVTYTTLGYGDVLLDENWRVLASYQAANGIIMFGWTTAIVMYAIRQVYFEGDVQ